MTQISLLAGAGLLFLAAPANAEIVADCGPSTGRSFFLTPQRDGWVDDGITGGRTFVVSHSEGFADFTAVSMYPATGVIETFAVTNLGHGSRQLLWTSNKSRVGVLGVTKVSAFVSECNP